jgi:glutathione S-transferase
MALDFYHGHGSPYGWRVWLALELKKVPYNVKILSFQAGDTRKPEFVKLNPRHTVPTIVEEDGHALWESLAILEYLDERHASGPKLNPGDAKARARVRRLIQEMEGYLDKEGIDPITHELFGKEGAAPDMERVETAKKRLGEELQQLTGEIRGKYLAGDEPSAADLVLYPWYGYVKRIAFRKPETKLTELVPAELRAWAERVEAWPFFDKTFPAHWR